MTTRISPQTVFKVRHMLDTYGAMGTAECAKKLNVRQEVVRITINRQREQDAKEGKIHDTFRIHSYGSTGTRPFTKWAVADGREDAPSYVTVFKERRVNNPEPKALTIGQGKTYNTIEKCLLRGKPRHPFYPLVED